MNGALGAMCGFAPYDLENLQSVGWEVVTNRPKAAAYRAPGAPMAAFAVESVMDELAKELDMDPIELRLMNAADEGTKVRLWPDISRHWPQSHAGSRERRTRTGARHLGQIKAAVWAAASGSTSGATPAFP